MKCIRKIKIQRNARHAFAHSNYMSALRAKSTLRSSLKSCFLSSSVPFNLRVEQQTSSNSQNHLSVRSDQVPQKRFRGPASC